MELSNRPSRTAALAWFAAFLGAALVSTPASTKPEDYDRALDAIWVLPQEGPPTYMSSTRSTEGRLHTVQLPPRDHWASYAATARITIRFDSKPGRTQLPPQAFTWVKPKQKGLSCARLSDYLWECKPDSNWPLTLRQTRGFTIETGGPAFVDGFGPDLTLRYKPYLGVAIREMTAQVIGAPDPRTVIFVDFGQTQIWRGNSLYYRMSPSGCFEAHPTSDWPIDANDNDGRIDFDRANALIVKIRSKSGCASASGSFEAWTDYDEYKARKRNTPRHGLVQFVLKPGEVRTGGPVRAERATRTQPNRAGQPDLKPRQRSLPQPRRQ